MLGTFPDAEDASQDILLKVITHLSSFKGDSAFCTWVFSIAMNHLKNYKKHMFAKFPLTFEFYGDDILNGKIEDIPDLTQDVEQAILAEELRMSCTNVMLLKFKSWYLEYPIQDGELLDTEAFLERAADLFRRMKPFNGYLNQALAGFQMPTR